MRLTLYSNCRLTKEYNEVIQGSHLENYLNSLTKLLYENIDDVYLTRRGTLNVEMLSSGMYLYNYFKLEDTNNSITRYFFIDDIDIVNGTCVISYTEDIWSSYSSYINIIKGNITNLRYGIGNTTPKYLPDNYISNKPLTLKSYLLNDGVRHTEFSVIVELSYYDPVASGDVIDRHFMTAVVYTSGTSPIKMNYDSASGYAEQILENMALGKNLKLPNDNTYKNYDITNVYIVPYVYVNGFGVSQSVYVSLTNVQQDIAHKFAQLNMVQYSEYTKNWSSTALYTRYAIGTLDNLITIEENGTDVGVGLLMNVDAIKFTMYLRVGTSIIDITNSFAYELPINIQSADITQQQAIARQVKNLTLDLNKQETAVKGSLGAVNGLVQTGLGAVQLASGGIGGIGSLVGGITSTASSVADTIFTMKEIDLQKWQNNLQAYSTSTAVKVNKDVFINCSYGIVEFRVVPDNNTYINNLLEVVGYRTNIIVNNNTYLTTAQESQNYNIIKFSNLMMYGNIPHSIQEELKAILTKGIKIYFTDAI